MKSKSNTWLKIFEFVIFLDLLNGAYAWFFWDIKASYLNLIFSILSFCYVKRNNIILGKRMNINIAFLLFYISTFITVDKREFTEMVSPIFLLFPLYTLAYDTENVNIILHKCLKWIAIILVPSILLHVLFLLTTFPPSFIIINESVPGSYVYYNYFFLIKNIVLENYQLRFCSIFLEPGYAGTLFVYLLYLSKFDFKKRYNLIILIALILTLSLAGYITFIISYIIYKLQCRQSIRKIIYVFIAFSCIYFIAINYQNGENVLNRNIISRLQYDEEKGVSGNNRVSTLTDIYLEKYLGDGTILMGIGNSGMARINGTQKDASFNDQIRGAGYKIYLIQYGLIRLLIVFLAYILLLKGTNLKYCVGLFCVFCITFIQAAYPMSTSWLIPFIFAVTINKQRKYENRNHYISQSA